MNRLRVAPASPAAEVDPTWPLPAGWGLNGQTALVTGAAGGIGTAITTALARAGAVVVALDHDGERAHELAAGLTTAGHTASAHRLDVTDPAAVNAVLATAVAEHGPPRLLVNVAGLLHHGPVTDFSDADWHRLFSVNVDGVFHLCRAVARQMIPHRQGAIVTITSNAASVPRLGLAAYAASKAAATMFTRCLGLELAGFGIRCNVIAPGSTDTPMLRQAGHDPASAIAGVPEQFRLGIPLRRIATPADVAAAALFLLSEHARHITMQTLHLDGGASLAD
ncbi:2,3-dihydro-2,3-dihydroxybenzoate dehydrogenase [[Actinomadura] parvosata]|uniref:2,3-dihydro-2,3-dihydroxybenzoate dehydrogenase n=1 Tax=[Actinomadura] parvosata TaxID=1955412 RepID=UPI0009AD1A69|nr:2,3-dihydro-2,3-dihydroxybenzoate dehydrogenase [Nonomuraea sp. ATCC 55076]